MSKKVLIISSSLRGGSNSCFSVAVSYKNAACP